MAECTTRSAPRACASAGVQRHVKLCSTAGHLPCRQANEGTCACTQLSRTPHQRLRVDGRGKGRVNGHNGALHRSHAREHRVSQSAADVYSAAAMQVSSIVVQASAGCRSGERPPLVRALLLPNQLPSPPSCGTAVRCAAHPHTACLQASRGRSREVRCHTCSAQQLSGQNALRQPMAALIRCTSCCPLPPTHKGLSDFR